MQHPFDKIGNSGYSMLNVPPFLELLRRRIKNQGTDNASGWITNSKNLYGYTRKTRMNF